MSRALRLPPLTLDMGFGEALARFGKTDLKELPETLY